MSPGIHRSPASATQSRTSSARTKPKVFKKELRVLRIIHESRNISRLDLAKRISSSAASMTAIVRRLIAKGMVIESGKNSTNLGRKPVSLSIRNDLGYLIGVDMGSYLIRVVVTDIIGSVLYKTEMETKMAEGRDRVLSRTFRAIHTAINESQTHKGTIRGIGMAHSGVIDSRKGMVLCFPRPGQMTQWKNVPLQDMLEKEFGVPSVMDDSARMMALAEKHFGFGKDMRDFLFIEVGMGIGASIFIDGKLYRGPGGSAGEFGHMTVDEKGPLCSCGNNGCLEAMASCAAIIHTVRAGIERGVNSKVSELVDGDLDRISIEKIIEAAKENDTLALRVLDEAVSHIGVALADVVNLLNPRAIIFGGPLFSKARDLILEPLKRVIRQRALEKVANDVRFMVSILGSEAGALGAAKLASEKVLESLYEERI